MKGVNRLKQLRRAVLVNSILYHVFDSPIATDAQFDSMVKALNDFPVPTKGRVPLAKEFEKWDGKSGFQMVHAVDLKWHNIALGVKNMVDRHQARVVD